MLSSLFEKRNQAPDVNGNNELYNIVTKKV
jgi:hypothetical protein